MLQNIKSSYLHVKSSPAGLDASTLRSLTIAKHKAVFGKAKVDDNVEDKVEDQDNGKSKMNDKPKSKLSKGGKAVKGTPKKTPTGEGKKPEVEGTPKAGAAKGRICVDVFRAASLAAVVGEPDVILQEAEPGLVGWPVGPAVVVCLPTAPSSASTSFFSSLDQEAEGEGVVLGPVLSTTGAIAAADAEEYSPSPARSRSSNETETEDEAEGWAAGYGSAAAGNLLLGKRGRREVLDLFSGTKQP